MKKIPFTFLFFVSALIARSQEKNAIKLYVNDSLTAFKLVKKALPNQFYLREGKVKPNMDNEPIYRVGRTALDNDTVTLKSMAIENGLSLKGRNYILIYADSITYEYSGKVNGYEFYEATGYIDEILIYSFIAKYKQITIICSALCHDNFEDNLREFKNLSRTIKIE